MRPDGHLSVVDAEVRGARVPRCAGVKLEGGRAWVLSVGLGLPRTWGLTTARVLSGFAEGLERSPTSHGPGRVEGALHAARQALVEGSNALIERAVPDATLLAMVLDGADAHVVAAGAGRAYLHRRGEPKRLTPRDEPRTGLLHAEPTLCSVTLDPGDLLLAGSSSAFSTAAIGRVASVLDRDPHTPPSVIAALLTEPAEQAGVGGVVLALRVR